MPVPSVDPYVSPYEEYCQGARDPNRYVIAMNVSAAKTKRRFGHGGSDGLDLINAFDLAEIDSMYMGQINMIEVSSFCGPDGFVWGSDLAAPSGLFDCKLFGLRQWDGREVPVCDGTPLVNAARSLFGTVDARRFPLAPGSHCATAHKSATAVGPAVLFAACGMGIRAAESSGATILMEDAGTLSPEMAADPAAAKDAVLRAVGESILAVAENQRIACRHIFVAYASVAVGEGEVGCALSMVPYFSLARRAVPKGGIDALKTLDLASWERSVTP
ncbi:MAG TPA: histidine decarboxylase, pyruvoyl type [Candidatus Eisenbacteria bacterium]|jgi:histidine decarboxylase|nr:histidine decarboxylase, pyruvoyl type [Candidatus Eisenbacteria bacterium]